MSRTETLRSRRERIARCLQSPPSLEKISLKILPRGGCCLACCSATAVDAGCTLVGGAGLGLSISQIEQDHRFLLDDLDLSGQIDP